MTDKTPRDYPIPDKWIKKWQVEAATWKNMLISRVEENILLKNRLADILKNKYDRNCLEEIEEFQTKSISEDKIISVLRMEVADLANSLDSENIEAEGLQVSFEETMNHLRNDMAYSEDSFGLLISAFEDFHQKVYRENEN